MPLVAEESSDSLAGPDGEEVLNRVVEYLKQLRADTRPEKVLSWIDRGQGLPGDKYWVLDPVDGTKGFLRGGQYAVALALVVAGQVEIGVIGCPHLDLRSKAANAGERCGPGSSGSLAVALRGRGAWSSDLGGEAFSPLQVSGCREPSGAAALRSYESGHTNEDQMEMLARTLELGWQPIRLDSMAKYLLLASGHGDLLFRLISLLACDRIACPQSSVH